MATRLLAVFFKSRGQEFIVAALKPVMDELLSHQPALTFEIDPVKLNNRDDPSVNFKNLKMLIKRLLKRIISAQSKFPQVLKDICYQVTTIVGSRFPEARVTSVGAFVFLRFICPIIVAPDNFGIVPQIQNKDIRRGLVLATKVIQNLANNVLFGAKESYMVDMNDLLKENITFIHDFLRYISVSYIINLVIELITFIVLIHDISLQLNLLLHCSRQWIMDP